MEPNRFRGVYGAAKAAERLGDREQARTYYEKLMTLCNQADTGRAEFTEAKAFLAKKCREALSPLRRPGRRVPPAGPLPPRIGTGVGEPTPVPECLRHVGTAGSAGGCRTGWGKRPSAHSLVESACVRRSNLPPEERQMRHTAPQEPAPLACCNQDDLVLLRRIAAHDHQAFEDLYQRFTPRLTGYLRTLLASSELVEDVLHDVWLVVWQQAARYRGSGRVSTWLFGIARHKALTAQARETRSALSRLPAPDRDDPTDPEYRVMRQEWVRLVRQACDALLPAQRQVLVLLYEHGYSAQAIATLQNCSVATVHYRKQQACHRLAIRLGVGTPAPTIPVPPAPGRPSSSSVRPPLRGDLDHTF
jgi:RNA polymerase sigma-70 factor (ECF subfamily)